MAFDLSSDKPIDVVKFGGTSVVAPRDVLNTIEQCEGKGKVMVVSALSGVTDTLLRMAVCDPITRDLLWCEVVEQHMALLEAHIPDAGTTITGDEARKFFAKERSRVDAESACLEGDKIALFIRDYWLYLGELFAAYVLEKILNFLSREQMFTMLTIPAVQGMLKEGSSESEMYQCLSANIRDALRPIIASGKVAIIPGHPGAFPNGGIMEHTDRGYSDWTAVLAAMACSDWQQVKLIIAKEIDNLFSIDPKLCREAKVRAEITTTELSELAEGAGMKAINPSAAALLVAALTHGCRIDLWVKNTMNPSAHGTHLVKNLSRAEQQGVRFVSGKDKQVFVTVRTTEMSGRSGWLEKIAKVAAEYRISLGPITGPNTSVGFTVDGTHKNLDQFVLKLRELVSGGGEVIFEPDVALIYCVGDQLGLDEHVYTAIGVALFKANIRARPLAFDSYNAIFMVPSGKFTDAMSTLNSLAVA